MTRQSLAAFRRTITVDWPQATAANAKDLLLRTARKGHADIMATGAARAGFTPDFEAYANSPGNPNLDGVTLPGPIVFNYDYRREIVEWALGALYKASPIQSGEYVASHTIYVDGQPVDALPDPLPQGARIMLANPVPYARRLEVGKTKAGRDFVLQVEPRIYERVAKGVLMPRFGTLAKISYGYADLPNAHTIKGGLSSHYQTSERRLRRGKLGPAGALKLKKRNQRTGSTVKAPAIFITHIRA